MFRRRIARMNPRSRNSTERLVDEEVPRLMGPAVEPCPSDDRAFDEFVQVVHEVMRQARTVVETDERFRRRDFSRNALLTFRISSLRSFKTLIQQGVVMRARLVPLVLFAAGPGALASPALPQLGAGLESPPALSPAMAIRSGSTPMDPAWSANQESAA